MPFWLLLVLGAGLVYLVKQGQSQAAGTAAGTLPDGTSSSYDDSIPTAQSVAVTPLAVGSSFQLPQGTKLFSDGKLTQSAGTGGGTSVVVTGTSVAADGSISVSYYDDASSKTIWFMQPGQ